MERPETSADRELPEQLGPFAIAGLLGEGGSAVVYAARWQELDVALKVARDERELSAREAERFLEEARMLSRVSHGSVVEVLDSGRLDDGRPYLVMRRYEGETLAEHLAREGALPLERALALFEQLADATAALHDAGLLHRDIKPENVYLVDGGHGLKLLDFGIAKEMAAPASTTTQAGIARGTPATMAPERFFGATATELTDVYELAVVLYAMTVGRLPWPDATNVNARLNPLSPIEAGASIPEALSTEILRALSTRPERRPRSVRELAERVKNAASGLGAAARVTAETVISEAPTPASSHRSDGAHVIDSRRAPAATAERARRLPFIAAAVGAALVVGGFLASSPKDEPLPEPAAAPSAPPAPEPKPPPPPAPATPEPAATASATAPPAASAPPVPKAPRQRAGAVRAGARPTASVPPGPSPGPSRGKPKGAPCTRSSECASMLCAAETCQ